MIKKLVRVVLVLFEVMSCRYPPIGWMTESAETIQQLLSPKFIAAVC